jgi:hypothetical protein
MSDFIHRNRGSAGTKRTSHSRIIKLHISQASFIQHIKLLLIHFGNISEIVGIVFVGLWRIRLSLLVSHVEPSGRDDRQFDILRLTLRQTLLHKFQLVQVCARRVWVRQFPASNDGISRHDFAVLLDEGHNIWMVETEHA